MNALTNEWATSCLCNKALRKTKLIHPNANFRWTGHAILYLVNDMHAFRIVLNNIYHRMMYLTRVVFDTKCRKNK